MGVVPGERVVLVHDEAHREMAELVTEAIRSIRGEVVAFCLERLGARPHQRLHPHIAEAMLDSLASLMLVDFHAGELGMRTELIDLAARYKLRHGHMVGVTRESMVAGFSADPHVIAEKMRALVARLRPDSRISVKSEAGTNLTAQLAPTARWVEYGTVVTPGRRVNLPGGELVTSPASVDGVYVADGTLGDADGALRRRVGDAPVSLRLKASRVESVECPRDPILERSISERLMRTANLDRVGLLNFGLNVGLGAPLGDVFTDQKLPGVHLSLGETFPEKTGAEWTSRSWIALTTARCDADIDRLPILRSGRYLV